LSDLELFISKSPEGCLQTIKSGIPSYYQLSKTFMPEKYSYRLTKNNLSIVSRGIGYPPVVLKVKLFEKDDNHTYLVARFEKSFLLRLIIWIITILALTTSALFILGILLDSNSAQEKILYVGLSLILSIGFVSYFLYTEIMRKREKERIITLVRNMFS
jgi:hypothetical protein